MWEVVNRTPSRPQGYFARDWHGAEHWIVALRACFAVRAARFVAIANTQEPARPAEYADILVRGTACATECVAARVGAIEKRERVTGKRLLRRTGGKGGRLSLEGPKEFTGIRLTWRAALGGTDPFAKLGGAAAEQLAYAHRPHPISVPAPRP